MNLGIDLDGTLNSFPSDIRRYLATVESLKHLHLSDEDYGLRRLEDVWNLSTKDVKSVVYTYLNSQFYSETVPIEGSVEAVKRLSRQHDLYVVTFRRESIREITESWLRKHFGNVFKEVIYTDGDKYSTKADACKQHCIDRMVDDSPHHIRALVEGGIPVVFFSGFFTTETAEKILKIMPKVIQARTWSEIEKILEK